MRSRSANGSLRCSDYPETRTKLRRKRMLFEHDDTRSEERAEPKDPTPEAAAPEAASTQPSAPGMPHDQAPVPDRPAVTGWETAQPSRVTPAVAPVRARRGRTAGLLVLALLTGAAGGGAAGTFAAT